MKRRALRVAFHAREPSVVELSLGDRVQLDRVIPTRHGCLAERHGLPLDPGVHTVALPPGHYFFKTLSDAHLRVVTGGVVTRAALDDKDKWPDPPPVGPDVRGDEIAGELPSFTID